MIPDKPYKTFEEQYQLLAEHDIMTEDEDGAKDFVIRQLKQYGYYNLVNAYQDKLANKNEKFDPPINFGFLILLKQTDEQLSRIFLPPLLHFENTFGIILSHCIADHFGVFERWVDGPGYLDSKHYQSNQMSAKKTLRQLRELATGKSANGDKISLKVSSSLLSYRNNHNHIPPWILINDTSLSELTNWYLISEPFIKEEIANEIFPGSLSLEVRKNLLADSLQIVRAYRNTIAHGTSISKVPHPGGKRPRKLKAPIVQYFNDSKILTTSDLDNGIGTNDLYSLLLILASQTEGYLGYITMLSQLKNIITATVGNENLSRQIFSRVFGLPTDIVNRLDHLIDFYKHK